MIEHILNYCRKNGIEVTVDNNPSPEKIERIKKNIDKRNAYMEALKTKTGI